MLPKKMAALIVAKVHPPKEDAPAPQEESDGDEGLHAAAEELIQAVESKDPKSVVMAFKSLWEQCEAKYPDEDSDDK